jgi:hypothetical protein
MNGTFTTNQSLPVSSDTTVENPALAWYDLFESIEYDGYVMANGCACISYIDYGGTRRYVAVGLAHMIEVLTQHEIEAFLIRHKKTAFTDVGALHRFVGEY